MEPEKKELDLEESLKQVMKTLPPFIRSYITEGKYTAVAQGLMSKYKLRVDQAGVLEKELVLLLMGIENPTEFTKALIDDAAIVDRMTVNNIIQDINNQVFIPLRKEEEMLVKSGTLQQKPPAPKPQVPSPTPQPPARPTPVAPSHIAPLPPKVVMPAAAGLGDVLRTIMAPKPVENNRLLGDHEEPHIELKPSAPPVVPAPVAPKVPVQPPIKESPLAPKAEPQPEPPPVIPSKLEIEPGLPQLNKVPPPPPITSYSKDPYREPFDE